MKKPIAAKPKSKSKPKPSAAAKLRDQIASFPSRLVSAVGGRIYNGVSEKISARMTEAFEEPAKFPRTSVQAYKWYKRYAAYCGVDQVFIDRTDAIFKQSRSMKVATDFLKTYINLQTFSPIDGYFDDFVSRLVTDEEKRLTKLLIDRQLADLKAGTQRNNLRIHEFRLRNAAPDDPEVLEFVHASLAKAVKSRLTNYKSRDKYFTKADAFAAMAEARKLFDAKGKRFFLSSGTLLGAIREKDFISNDYDIDLGIFPDEVSLAEIKQIFKRSKFTLVEDYDYKVAFKSSKGIILEFFSCPRIGGDVFMQGWRGVHRWIFSDFDLIEIRFLGKKFWVPENYEKHLAENFGNWRQRTIFYDVSYDCPNRTYGNNVEALGYLTERMARALDNNWRYWANEPAKQLRDYFDIDYTRHFPSKSVGVLPPNMRRVKRQPLIVLDAFDEISPPLMRILESAADLNDRVIAGVFNIGAKRVRDAKRSGRLAVAKAVRHVSETYLLESFADLARMTSDLAAVRVVVSAELAARIQPFLARYGIEIDMLVFERDAACLTLKSNGQIIVRQKKKLPVVPTVAVVPAVPTVAVL